jgi:hypothetical protein
MTTIHPNSDWHPISTAPRDGTEVDLTWMEDGQPQEVWPMCWSLFAGTDWRGIWVMCSKLSGALLCTWTEEDPSEGPTHWRYRSKA